MLTLEYFFKPTATSFHLLYCGGETWMEGMKYLPSDSFMFEDQVLFFGSGDEQGIDGGVLKLSAKISIRI